MTGKRNIWADDPANFERLRQNFTTSLFVSGPNMTLPEMSERLCEMRDRIEAQAALIAELTEALTDALGLYQVTHIHARIRAALARAEEAQK